MIPPQFDGRNGTVKNGTGLDMLVSIALLGTGKGFSSRISPATLRVAFQKVVAIMYPRAHNPAIEQFKRVIHFLIDTGNMFYM